MPESQKKKEEQSGKKEWIFPFSEQDWAATPESVRNFLVSLVASQAALEKRVEELEKKLNKNSSNSSKPPSSDDPYKEKPKKNKKTRKKKKRRKGYQQKMLEPTEVKNLKPEACICGNTKFDTTAPYYTHQVIELPEIQMEVTHFVLYKGEWPCCGKVNKAVVPKEHRTGFGPRLSAMIAQMGGNMGDSRSIIQDFCSSVLGFHISLGAIQKVIDRVSKAIKPHYETIGEEAREASVNYIDETSHRKNGKLEWLWVMANNKVDIMFSFATNCIHFDHHGRYTQQLGKSFIRNFFELLLADSLHGFRNVLYKGGNVWQQFHGKTSNEFFPFPFILIGGKCPAKNASSNIFHVNPR